MNKIPQPSLLKGFVLRLRVSQHEIRSQDKSRKIPQPSLLKGFVLRLRVRRCRVFVKHKANRKKKSRPPALLANMSFVLRHKVKLLRRSKHTPHEIFDLSVFTLCMMPLRNIWFKYVKLVSQDYRQVELFSFLSQTLSCLAFAEQSRDQCFLSLGLV